MVGGRRDEVQAGKKSAGSGDDRRPTKSFQQPASHAAKHPRCVEGPNGLCSAFQFKLAIRALIDKVCAEQTLGLAWAKVAPGARVCPPHHRLAGRRASGRSLFQNLHEHILQHVLGGLLIVQCTIRRGKMAPDKRS